MSHGMVLQYHGIPVHHGPVLIACYRCTGTLCTRVRYCNIAMVHTINTHVYDDARDGRASLEYGIPGINNTGVDARNILWKNPVPVSELEVFWHFPQRLSLPLCDLFHIRRQREQGKSNQPYNLKNVREQKRVRHLQF